MLALQRLRRPQLLRRALRRLRFEAHSAFLWTADALASLLTPFRRPGSRSSPQRRFLSDRAAAEGQSFLQAARAYVASKSAEEVAWLHRKPFDPSPGNPGFYTEMYQVLNLLQAMRIRPFGRVLEVGCGPGWATEILALLGFSVDALDPAPDMIAMARQRVECALRGRHVADPPEARFHETTLEDCALPAGAFDAVFFHEALHHLIDEERGLAQCSRLLREGGVLGVSEAAWKPGDRVLEDRLEAEILRFGTLESPYTQEYLDGLLARHGFVEIQRYHAINGLFPREHGRRTLEQLASVPAWDSNNLTARKRGSAAPAATSADLERPTRATISVLEWSLSGLQLTVVVALKNSGETVWLAGGPETGEVNVALRAGLPGEPDFLEAEPRQPLPCPVAPRESVTLALRYRLPEGARARRWEIDLVSERLFWFSARGSRARRVLPS